MSSHPDPHHDDVPSPIDLREEADAAAWVAAADVTRPWRAQVRTAIAELLRTELPPPLRILELGPGPGLLAEVVLGACQVESYTLLDFSAPMLARCRQRLGGHSAVHFVQDDFTRPGWTAALVPPFDAVLAMQAVHEVRHKRHVPRLYAQIVPVLRPGGCLIVITRRSIAIATVRCIRPSASSTRRSPPRGSARSPRTSSCRGSISARAARRSGSGSAEDDLWFLPPRAGTQISEISLIWMIGFVLV